MNSGIVFSDSAGVSFTSISGGGGAVIGWGSITTSSTGGGGGGGAGCGVGLGRGVALGAGGGGAMGATSMTSGAGSALGCKSSNEMILIGIGSGSSALRSGTTKLAFITKNKAKCTARTAATIVVPRCAMSSKKSTHGSSSR